MCLLYLSFDRSWIKRIFWYLEEARQPRERRRIKPKISSDFIYTSLRVADRQSTAANASDNVVVINFEEGLTSEDEDFVLKVIIRIQKKIIIWFIDNKLNNFRNLRCKKILFKFPLYWSIMLNNVSIDIILILSPVSLNIEFPIIKT